MNLIWNVNFVVWAAAAFAFGHQSMRNFEGPESLESREEKLCKDFHCYNGGTCTLKGYYMLFCLCPPDYTGKQCQLLKEDATPKGKLPSCGSNRMRRCHDYGHKACVVDQDCPGNKTCCNSRCGTVCYDPSCDKCEWSEWSKCEPFSDLWKTCGYGRQLRTRKPDCCQNPDEMEYARFCEMAPCTPCEMGPWGAWSSCDVSCGTGLQSRGRSPQEKIRESFKCDMPSDEVRECSLPDCPCVDESRQCANLPECEGTNAYEGMKNKTRNGVTCQYWDSQSPNKHRFSEVGHHNYCRNLDDFGGPWCYTTDGDLPFDFCFPDCQEYRIW